MSSSQQMFQSGQAHGQGAAEADQLMQSARSTGDAACGKAAEAAHSAQQGKEHAAGFMQQTGEQVMNMANNAVDSVKNTLGMGDSNPTKRN